VHRLPRVLPRNIALELIATGAPIGAERACALGLVNRLTGPGTALAAATELARTIAGNAPLAVQEALAAAKAALDVPDAEGQALAEAAMARLRGTADYAEGPRAFLEKRPARWTGR
jgi:enoyl-CoA hydratase/carnithine racemase